MKSEKSPIILKRKLDFESIINQYRAIGGVIHYFIWEMQPTVLKSSTRIHRQVAIHSMQALVNEWEAEIQRRMKLSSRKYEDFFRMTFQREILENEMEMPKKLDINTFLDDYTYAFLSPPYSLQKNGETHYYHLNTALLACKLPNLIQKEVLLENHHLQSIDLEIYQWTDKCSNFFYAGAEWWGTYFYTIYVPALGHYVCILASTTD